MYEVVGSTRKGAICLDRSRNPIVLVLCIHYVCLGEILSIFFRDLNDASIFDLSLFRGLIAFV